MGEESLTKAVAGAGAVIYGISIHLGFPDVYSVDTGLGPVRKV